MIWSPRKTIAVSALLVLALDQLTKYIVLKTLNFREEIVVLDGFFRFVHWGNTGAAWSLFRDNNFILAAVSFVALFVLYLTRHHFEADRRLGQISLGMIFGGILGNLTDRLIHHHVIDFLYFYVNRRGGEEIGFPAFNVADSAICVGVGIIFILSWTKSPQPAESSA